MDYYTSWTISSVAKLITAALNKTGSTGVYILVGGATIGGYVVSKKIRELEKEINDLKFKVTCLEAKNGR